MKIRLEWETRKTGKLDCRVSIGPTRDELALVGVMTMPLDEARAFHHTIRMGVREPGCEGIFERGLPALRLDEQEAAWLTTTQ